MTRAVHRVTSIVLGLFLGLALDRAARVVPCLAQPTPTR